jgi:hypothetical protein
MRDEGRWMRDERQKIGKKTGKRYFKTQLKNLASIIKGKKALGPKSLG